MSVKKHSEAKLLGKTLVTVIGSPFILMRDAGNATFPKCDKCHKRFGRLNNHSKQITHNYSEFDISFEATKSYRFLCPACYSFLAYAQCSKTNKVFRIKDDQSAKYNGSQMCKNLSPHHPSSKVTGLLSPEGFDLISRAHDALQTRFRNWAGCSKQDYLRKFRITKEIGLIREDAGHDDPASVEEALKWHCLQIGGNGLIKFFWDKHIRHHEEEYVAGYGKNGNPYHRTRRWTTADFSGHAVAVTAETVTRPSKKRQRSNNSRTGANQPNEQSKPSEADYWNILGISGEVTKQDIREAYRKAMQQYHPDKVASLGEDLRKVAEQKTKEINEAYEFFKKRYNM